MAVEIRGHVPGAYLLVATELLERFSYYGMRALLILYMTATIASGGLGWGTADALAFYGMFTSAIWLAPVAGGFIADRWLGQRRAVLAGGMLMAIGHMAIAASTVAAARFSAFSAPFDGALGQWPLPAAAWTSVGPAGSAPFQIYALTTLLFLGGLGCVVIGNGLLKPSITVMLGQLYPPRDPRRETAYTLFYIGVSMGAVLAGLSAGTAGEVVGWGWGFALCALVMLSGIGFYAVAAPRLLGAVGLRTDAADAPVAGAADSTARHPLIFIAVLSAAAIIFWTGYEQSGGLLNVFAFESVDRSILGFTIPATWLQSLGPVFIIIFGLPVATLLERLQRRGIPLDPPRRFAIGLLVGSAAFLVLGGALAGRDEHDGLLPILWLFLFYLLLTIAELVLSPAGFAMVTRYAPMRRASLFMGVWLLSVAIGSALAGRLGAWGSGQPLHVTMLALAAAFACIAVILFLSASRLNRLVDEPGPSDRASVANPVH